MMGSRINWKDIKDIKDIKEKTLPYAGTSLRDQSCLPEVSNNEMSNNEKSDSLFNRQETVEVGGLSSQLCREVEETETGSSETETQSSSQELDPKEIGPTLDSDKPSQILSYPTDFIDWFVGFVEGDGSFSVNNQTDAVSLIISQKDPKVLYFIKKHLGFGRVYRDSEGYFRFSVYNPVHVGYLINIFKGRLRLEKTNVRFEAWVAAYTRRHKWQPIELIRGNIAIDATNAWFSGFIDAEGCFDAPQRSGRKTFRMRFTIKQKLEYQKLTDLLKFAGPGIKWGNLANRKEVAIHTVDSLVMLKYLIKYLERYPLRSIKNVAYVKWLKLLRVVAEGGRGKDYEAIKKMAQEINKFEDEDTVHGLEKD